MTLACPVPSPGQQGGELLQGQLVATAQAPGQGLGHLALRVGVSRVESGFGAGMGLALLQCSSQLPRGPGCRSAPVPESNQGRQERGVLRTMMLLSPPLRGRCKRQGQTGSQTLGKGSRRSSARRGWAAGLQRLPSPTTCPLLSSLNRALSPPTRNAATSGVALHGGAEP